jgi:uncharacterized repeat protein (TIGR01451 family)
MLRSRLGLARWALGVAVGSLLACCPPALADRAFTPRFSANASGDITIVGNTLETCQAATASCLSARAGTGSLLNNNNFVMERVDVDRTMLDSSSARLTMPAGARVLFAGLYYGARTSAGTSGKSAPNATTTALRTVDLKPPGAIAFERLSGELDESTEVKGAYAVFVDVTNQVRRDGSGIYTVANVQSATGEDRYAGWALVVAYESAGDPPRNLTVFDGLQSVTQGKSALTIPVSGFQTPLSGPVRTRLGFIAYEGDLGLTGDSASLDGKPLSDAVNPANNMFNSTISADGRNRTDKNPDYINQLGFDANLIGINGILANGATSANIALKTSSDQYLPQVVTFATDLYAPVIRSTKTVTNLTHPGEPARAGDRLRYTVSYANDGLEAARAFVAEDALPADITYLAGSLRVAGGPTPTDVQGDDLGEYDASNRSVRFFLGAGARAGSGGTLGAAGHPDSQAEVSFEARVDENVTKEHDVTNVARASFVAPTLKQQLGALSSPATIRVIPNPSPPAEADIATAQSETVAPSQAGGDTVDDHILVIDQGPADATDVVIHDSVPAGSVIDSVTSDQGECSINGLDITCVVPHLDAGGAVDVNVITHETSGDAAAGSSNEAIASAAQFDPTPGNNATDVSAPPPSASAETPAALTVDVREASAGTPLGGRETEKITIVNDGPGTATDVDVTDVLNGATKVIAIKPGAASCTSRTPLRCRINSLRAGRSETIDLEVQALRPGQLIDAVSASDAQPNPRLARDHAVASALVKPRRSAARLRIVPITPVATSGQVVEFVVIAAAIKPVPGLSPRVCLALPHALNLVTPPAAPGLTAGSFRLCRQLTDLTSGQAQTFRFRARLGATSNQGATVAVRGQLTGANFSATSASATVHVSPRVTGCPSKAETHPPGRMAC